jgi:NAD(P)-dependent dehydrogenase (short-subunit alcohol dehydrogenase family)
VNPATIDTPMVQELAATSAQRRQPSVPLTQLIPMGRHGTADEVARLMLYLASDESSFCTGGVYMVDGGVSAGRAF